MPANRSPAVSRLRLAVTAAVVLLAAGCQTQAPPPAADIRKDALQELALPQAWKAGGQPAPIADNWLAGFNDAQLDALVAEAIARNPDLRVAATKVEQAGEYVNLAKAALLPTISLFGSGGVNMGGGDPLQILSLGISWEIDLWGRLRYARNAAEESYASTQADLEFARQSLAATTAKAWFTAAETGMQQTLADDMVGSARQLVELAEKRREVGVGDEQDIAVARANLASFEDNARQINLAHSQALRALELLLGRYPAAELKARADLPALPGPVPAGMPLEMLERRPDLVAAERRVAAAFNRVGEAKAAQLPSLSLNANVAAISSDIVELQDDFDNPTGGAGARLLAPIYQGGALTSQVEIKSLQQKEAVADYARLALRAIGDVENALAAGAILDERQQFLQRSVADNQRALELTETRYRVGKSDLRAVRQQQLEVYAARLALLRVQSEQLAQRVNLHLALGGSFESRLALKLATDLKQ